MSLTPEQRDRLWELLAEEPAQAAQLAESLTGWPLQAPMLLELQTLAEGCFTTATRLTRVRLPYLGELALRDDLRIAPWLLGELYARTSDWNCPIQDPSRWAARKVAKMLRQRGETTTARYLYLTQVDKRGRVGLSETMPDCELQRLVWPLIEGTADPADWLIKPYRARLVAAVDASEAA